MIDQKLVRKRLILTEIVWFIIGGAALIAYFYDPGFLTIGVLFVLEYVISIISTLLWLLRTEPPSSQTPDTRSTRTEPLI